MGKGATGEAAAEIVAAIERGPDDAVEKMIHLKTRCLGPEETPYRGLREEVMGLDEDASSDTT